MFGPEFGAEHFLLDPEVNNLNHGSFGVAAKVAVESQVKALYTTQAYPETYYRLLGLEEDPRIKLRTAIAAILGADPHNLVCTNSATTAYSAVLRSIPLQRGDKIVYMSSIYINDINTLKSLQRSHGIELVQVVIEYPRNNETLLAAFEEAIKGAKLAVFDTVSSMPSDVLPFAEMTALCNKHGVMSFVDGAHGIGIVPLDLAAIKPSFFTTNLHKWYHAPPGSSVLYVDSQYHDLIEGFPIAAFDPLRSDPNRLAKTFGYMSTMNYSAFDATFAALEFHQQIGGDAKIMAYQNELAEKACALVCAELGVKELGTPGPRIAMFTVECPVQTEDPEFVLFVTKIMFAKKTFVPISLYRGKLYLRFSATIYLDIKNFERGLVVLKEVFEAWHQHKNAAGISEISLE